MKRLLFCLLLGAGIAPVDAQSEFTARHGWLHLNGYSHHFAVDDANDHLLGLGYTHYRHRYGRAIRAWEFEAFQDSGKKFSSYIGHSWTIPFEHFSAGLTGAVMYHRNFAAQNRLNLLPVAFPFLETRGTRMKIRLYYVAPVRRASDQQIALQIMFPLYR